MRLGRNISALNTSNLLFKNETAVQKVLEKLSSGNQINRAGDDAAGLAISEKMRGQIHGLEMAGKNIQDGISLIQTAEGGMSEIHSILQRVRELTIQSANDTNTDLERDFIQQEVSQLFEEIDSISNRTEFNGMKLLRGGGMISLPGGGGSGSGVSGTMLTGEDLKNAQKAFTKRLEEEILESAEEMIEQFYGLTVPNNKTITISYITDAPNGMVARVKMLDNPIMEFDNADLFTTGSLWIDPDRIAAHEMVHAVMAATDLNMNGMPGWFIEGSAEYLPGAMERLKSSVRAIGANNVVKLISSSGGGSHYYSSGYAATMYMDVKIRQADSSKSLKDVLTLMQSSTKNYTLDQALKEVVGNHYGLNRFIQDYKANGTQFIEQIIQFDTNGSIQELTVNADNSVSLSKEPDIIGITQLDEGDGFKVKWDNSTYYDQINTTSNPYVGVLETIENDGTLMIQLGANEGQTLELTMPTISVDALGLADVDVKVIPDYSLTLIDNAISGISSERSKLGALQNRLEHAYNNVMNTAENLTSAKSRIRDADMAKEVMNFTKLNILIQASQSMLSQANQQPQSVLQLLNA